jgi:hypothetical protein
MSELFTESPVEVVDRSTLEGWAECPQQAWQRAHVNVRDISIPAMVGSECHDIISDVITQHIASPMRTSMFADVMKESAANSRPDLQPQIVDVFRAGSWLIAETITQQANGEPRSPDEIQRYDGGEGERSGQLAADVPMDGVIYRLTGELDLLLATASPVELEIDDWKSGFRHWTATDVRDSFQFQFYASLVFRNYPTCEAVSVKIIMPRKCEATSPVRFVLKDLYAINARITTALSTYAKYRHAINPAEIPCYPSPERCDWCACKAFCPAVKRTVTGLAETPEGMLRDLVATRAAADMMETKLAKVGEQA